MRFGCSHELAVEPQISACPAPAYELGENVFGSNLYAGMSIMKTDHVVIVAAVLAGFASAAQAQTYDFSFSSGTSDFGLTETGALTVQATNTAGIFQILSVTGTEDLYIGGTPSVNAITGILSPDPVYQADNLLYLTGGPLLDDSGFSFTVDGPGADFHGDVNIAYVNGKYVTPYELIGGSGTFSVTPTGVPEPGSLPLAAGGFVLTAALGLRKARQ